MSSRPSQPQRLLSEAALTKRICDQMRNAGALVQPIIGGALGVAGWPDRMIVHPLWFGYIEFKKGANQLTKIQEYIHREINRRRPHASFVCRFVEHAGPFVVRVNIEYLGSVVFENHFFGGEELLNTLASLTDNK